MKCDLPPKFPITVYIKPNFLKSKCNESGFMPLLCTYRLNWARRASWRWWDDWDDTVLQTQDSRPSTLPLGHGGCPQYWLSHVDGEEIFFLLLSNRRDREPNPELNTTLGPPPNFTKYHFTYLIKAPEINYFHG